MNIFDRFTTNGKIYHRYKKLEKRYLRLDEKANPDDFAFLEDYQGWFNSTRERDEVRLIYEEARKKYIAVRIDELCEYSNREQNERDVVVGCFGHVLFHCCWIKEGEIELTPYQIKKHIPEDKKDKHSIFWFVFKKRLTEQIQRHGIEGERFNLSLIMCWNNFAKYSKIMI